MQEPLNSFVRSMIPAVEQDMRAVLQADEQQNELFYGMMHLNFTSEEDLIDRVSLINELTIFDIIS